MLMTTSGTADIVAHDAPLGESQSCAGRSEAIR